MSDQNSKKTMRVEDLERYGVPLADMPKEAFEGQGKIILGALKNKFGLFGMFGFFMQVLRERSRILKNYKAEYQRLAKITPKGSKEITMLVSMFNVIERRESRDAAYKFVQGIFQSVALKSLPAIYQLDKLVQCEGDVFDNFKKFTVAMFEAGGDVFRVKEMEEDENHLRIVVDKCLNVDAGNWFDCPDIAMLGCDHDLASFPHVEPVVKTVFRRPCTLAKGGDCCDFHFYREGFEPEGPYENK